MNQNVPAEVQGHNAHSAAEPQRIGVRPSPGAATSGAWRCGSKSERPARRRFLRPSRRRAEAALWRAAKAERPHSERFHRRLRTIPTIAGQKVRRLLTLSLRHPDPGGKLATRSDGVMECWSAGSTNSPPLHDSLWDHAHSTGMTNRRAGQEF